MIRKSIYQRILGLSKVKIVIVSFSSDNVFNECLNLEISRVAFSVFLFFMYFNAILFSN